MKIERKIFASWRPFNARAELEVRPGLVWETETPLGNYSVDTETPRICYRGGWLEARRPPAGFVDDNTGLRSFLHLFSSLWQGTDADIVVFARKYGMLGFETGMFHVEYLPVDDKVGELVYSEPIEVWRVESAFAGFLVVVLALSRVPSNESLDARAHDEFLKAPGGQKETWADYCNRLIDTASNAVATLAATPADHTRVAADWESLRKEPLRGRHGTALSPYRFKTGLAQDQLRRMFSEATNDILEAHYLGLRLWPDWEPGHEHPTWSFRSWTLVGTVYARLMTEASGEVDIPRTCRREGCNDALDAETPTGRATTSRRLYCSERCKVAAGRQRRTSARNEPDKL